MHDDEIGRLIRRSLDGHAGDVHPSPDLGEWVMERGRVVQRRRRVTVASGVAAGLASVVAAAVIVPRLGAEPQQPQPAGPTVSRTVLQPAPTTTTPSPDPSRTTRAPRPTTTTERSPQRSQPPASPTATDTGSASPSATPTDLPSPSTAGTAAPGSTFDTPFGAVAFPTGASVKIAGTRAGDRYLALVGSHDSTTDSAPPNQARLLSVASDGSAIVLASAGNGSARSFATSPNGRFVVVAIHDDGGERLEAYRVGELGTRASYIVPAEWRGEIVGWATEGVTLRGTQAPHELVWQMDSGRVTVRTDPTAAPTTLVTGR
ncbi:hypothetical protein [Arsenicicoccus sp. oral taxon 190]|uniref:hypothetical protein n=1 Tax=Arsenicicoccus sp. oral taxon 190 TaxID=1658671 RepID=UPI00067A0197|nr:hypothetical protein [Arsenicicoccus sp. oral taxon 190]AKT51076.1 hypothetical protein ADJ73_06645 [Arsenicicoccus sp. oral taxon 190]